MKNLFMLFVLVGLSARAQPKPFQKAFTEEFDKPTSPYFSYGSTGQKLSFKYAQGIASLIEPKTTILSFNINPDEAPGAGKGPEIISTNFTHFGTYSARLKVPAVTTLQPNVGAVVGYFTYHMDSIPGLRLTSSGSLPILRLSTLAPGRDMPALCSGSAGQSI